MYMYMYIQNAPCNLGIFRMCDSLQNGVHSIILISWLLFLICSCYSGFYLCRMCGRAIACMKFLFSILVEMKSTNCKPSEH